MVDTTLVDLVKINVTSSGSGPFHLGDAVSAYRGVEALTDGGAYHYSVQQSGQYEYGKGVYDATAMTLTREVIDSSLADILPVPFSAGAELAFPALAQDIGGGGSGGAVINDGLISPNFVWSSQKTNNQITISAATLSAGISTLAASTTDALATKEPSIAPGLNSQFLRGDKTWAVPPSGGGSSGIRELASYGPISTPTEVNSTLATAYAALAGTGIPLLIGGDYKMGTTPPANPQVTFTGDNILSYSPAISGSLITSPGNLLTNKPGREDSLMTFGQEWIAPRFLHGLVNGQARVIYIIGDSNGAYYGAMLATLLATLPNVTVVNNSVGGTTFGQWFYGTGVFATTEAGKKYSAVMAANPDLLIDLYGGTNEPNFGGTPTTFLADKIAGYNAIRAAKTIQQMALAMASAGGMSDGDTGGAGWHRDERANAAYRPMIRWLAQAYLALYTAQHERFPDSTIDFIAGPAQNLEYDANRVHNVPGTALYSMRAQAAYEDIVPSFLRPAVSNLSGNTLVKNGNDLPTTYPFSLSYNRGITNFPFQGFVETDRPTDGWAKQVNWGLGTNGYFYRLPATQTTFGPWQFAGTSSVTNVGVGTGFALPGTDNLAAQRQGGMVNLSGRLTQSTPAALTQNQLIAAITGGPASGFNNVPAIEIPIRIFLYAAASPFFPIGVISGRILTNGQIYTTEAFSTAVASLFISESFSNSRP